MYSTYSMYAYVYPRIRLKTYIDVLLISSPPPWFHCNLPIKATRKSVRNWCHACVVERNARTVLEQTLSYLCCPWSTGFVKRSLAVCWIRDVRIRTRLQQKAAASFMAVRAASTAQEQRSVTVLCEIEDAGACKWRKEKIKIADGLAICPSWCSKRCWEPPDLSEPKERRFFSSIHFFSRRRKEKYLIDPPRLEKRRWTIKELTHRQELANACGMTVCCREMKWRPPRSRGPCVHEIGRRKRSRTTMEGRMKKHF
jgi:hypothetical protein